MIQDGKRRISTGCPADDRTGAERTLARYLIEHGYAHAHAAGFRRHECDVLIKDQADVALCPIPPLGAGDTGHVYVISLVGVAMVKIGWSREIERRLSDWRRIFPAPYVVHGLISAQSELEHQLHQRFRRHRTHGEWFVFKGSVGAWVRAGCPPPRRLKPEKPTIEEFLTAIEAWPQTRIAARK